MLRVRIFAFFVFAFALIKISTAVLKKGSCQPPLVWQQTAIDVQKVKGIKC
jgi:hypothetical protein